MSDFYAIKDTTLTALGDAVRNKTFGTTELPILTVENQYVDYNKCYPNVMPIWVKKVKINGFIKFHYNSETFNVSEFNGCQGLGVAPGEYGTYDEDEVRENSDYTIVWHPYPAGAQNVPTIINFETIIESNAWAFVATKAYNGPDLFNITYTAVGLDENGNEFKYTPLEMAEKVNELMIIPDEALTITGDCSYRFANNALNWLMEQAGDKIITNDITNTTSMFYGCVNLEYIPFDINIITTTYMDMGSMFENCYKLKELPKINNAYPSTLTYFFRSCQNIREIPEDYFDTWKWDRIHTATNARLNYMFNYCYSLRKIPPKILNELWNMATGATYSLYSYGFANCSTLDEIIGLALSRASLTSNHFSNTFQYCYRLKDMIFQTNEDGTPQTANWKNQTIDLSSYVGYGSLTSYILDYNSGITADKQVTDDATYQALKDDPDWYSVNYNYSRYNHDSAVNTINSLPDCSASGGTNTIKFKGEAGALTDGGAINTLTEEEIAVATAKGWTVSLV